MTGGKSQAPLTHPKNWVPAFAGMSGTKNESHLMRMILALAAALTLTACATGPSPSIYSHSAGDTSFTGWVRFANEEFQLYGNENQVLQPFARPCVSGAASRDVMRQARTDLNGAKVTITGTTRPWSAATGGRIEHAGSVIRNDCGGAFVVLADGIRPAN